MFVKHKTNKCYDNTIKTKTLHLPVDKFKLTINDLFNNIVFILSLDFVLNAI
jgi:hypothetical protein